ncbi:MAG: alpha/beta hydrolase [Gemmatimonadales bacterium]|nr:MAG: alpha/beta hydrolase [Gemmatimonadales bacterium]
MGSTEMVRAPGSGGGGGGSAGLAGLPSPPHAASESRASTTDRRGADLMTAFSILGWMRGRTVPSFPHYRNCRRRRIIGCGGATLHLPGMMGGTTFGIGNHTRPPATSTDLPPGLPEPAMPCPHRLADLPMLAAFLGLLILLPVLTGAPGLDAQEPPAAPPADWGPVSITMEEVPYPHPVSHIEFSLYGQDLRMAFMDVAPTGAANGRTVVLLHGGNYWAASWEGVIDDLAEAGFRVVAMDQIGYGRSSKPILPYSLDMHAGNIARVLDHLGIEGAALVGHSYGGMKASRFALLYPERTTHVGLVNAIGLADARAGRGWSEPQAAPDRSYEAALATIRGHVEAWDDAYLEYVRVHYGWGLSGDWPRLAMVRALNSDVIRTSTVVHDWPQIEAPALVIGGELDGPRFPELARAAADAFPNGELVLFPGVGHNPHWEARELLSPALIEFLGR